MKKNKSDYENYSYLREVLLGGNTEFQIINWKMSGKGMLHDLLFVNTNKISIWYNIIISSI